MNYSLRSNVAVEPAIGGWYAWSYLIPPHTLARFIHNRFIPIIESYLEDPQVHAMAVKQPKMHGGPWVHAYEHYDQIKNWYESVRGSYDRPLELFEAIKQLEEKILPDYTGESLDSVYQRLPLALAGRVEVFYGRDNKTPDYRFIEPLMYASDYYDESLQQVRFREITDDAREFALTTPVLEYTDQELVVTVPFKSPLIDMLFRGDLSESDLTQLEHDLAIPAERSALFRSYFEAAPAVNNETGSDRMEYVGHASVYAQYEGKTFLVDPVLSYGGYEGAAEGKFSYDDLPAALDYLLITHNHTDHMLFETLLRIRHKVGTILVPKSSTSSMVDPGLARILRNLGFTDVVELDDLDTRSCGSVQVTAVPFLGEHGDLQIRTKSGWHLRFGEKTALFAADSTNISPTMYAKVTELIGRVNTVFIGMESIGAAASWIYGPLFSAPLARRSDQSRRLNGSNFEQGRDIVDALDPDEVYTYAMGLESWMGNLMAIDYDENHPAIIDSNALTDYAISRGRTSKCLFIRETLPL